ncbi:hypothetical protein H7I93_05405 [Mycobacterium nebraskense]|uniref:SF4 helicase domain-containing protein n=1 Tax=Mycobacterium kubicae TaxID=120959 RepID=A0AAX1J6X9_9MYCO|nr:hypothetical protein [Mycobacterium sp. WUMAC-067]MCA2311565.1 hypothetical protein [Mycobacterium intracellulare subsp. chimaera]MCA2317930.1 hypothetical protein [Mycobacterium sp. WUMAC-025]MCA4732223.1 hypothetical protein [Mycobacterium avium subsp. hominissuis]MCV7008997.1 hypothetical protein [Mycobacterium gordonae]MCV7116702.1 hypothetical protein [Mycobacterium nebraskense]MCV7353763.1 hypothetical protein [Mycobacterium parmense]QPI37254.1 hypothetical protein I2456_23125 [Myco
MDTIATNGGLARGVPTGFADLDEITCGLQPGTMVTVAARPGVGKVRSSTGFHAIVFAQTSDGQCHLLVGNE